MLVKYLVKISIFQKYCLVGSLHRLYVFSNNNKSHQILIHGNRRLFNRVETFIQIFIKSI